MKIVKKLLKYIKNFNFSRKNLPFSEKNYIKEILKEKRKNKINLDAGELCLVFGTTKEFMENLVNEINEEEKIVSEVKKEEPKKPKQERKKRQAILDDSDKGTLKDIALKVALFGIPINFSIYCFLYHPFTFYSWVAYGYSLWLIKKELVPQLRHLIHK